MSLATRCVACGTIFRVVQDQLKVSEGWVRCGRCDEVFNALEGLFDLDHDAPPRWNAALPAPSADGADDIAVEPPRAVVAPPAPYDEPAASEPAPAPAYAPAGPDEPFDRRFDELMDRPAGPDVEVHLSTHDDAEPRPWPADPVLASARVDMRDFATVDPEAAPSAAEPDGRAPFTPTPAFVARAERDARWRQPGRLAGLAGLILLLAVMLAAQAAHHFRDTVAARWPMSREPLQRWCELADCQLAAPRRIEDIVVENTGLARAVAGTDTYRIAVTLHNRGTQTLTLPSIDLTLTDNGGQLVARRALAPADFQQAATTLAPNADVPLQALIATGSSKVSGYTVEIFYP